MRQRSVVYRAAVAVYLIMRLRAERIGKAREPIRRFVARCHDLIVRKIP
jgi:hypothetical protein